LLDGRLVVLGERDQAADALAPAGLHVLLTGPVAVLAREPLGRVPRPLEEEAAHPRRLELVIRLFVAALSRLGADVPGGAPVLARCLLSRRLLRRGWLRGRLLGGRRLSRRLLRGWLLSRHGPGATEHDEDECRDRDGQRHDDNPNADRRGPQ